MITLKRVQRKLLEILMDPHLVRVRGDTLEGLVMKTTHVAKV
jgi:hypothetical protein